MSGGATSGRDVRPWPSIIENQNMGIQEEGHATEVLMKRNENHKRVMHWMKAVATRSQPKRAGSSKTAGRTRDKKIFRGRSGGA